MKARRPSVCARPVFRSVGSTSPSMTITTSSTVSLETMRQSRNCPAILRRYRCSRRAPTTPRRISLRRSRPSSRSTLAIRSMALRSWSRRSMLDLEHYCRSSSSRLRSLSSTYRSCWQWLTKSSARSRLTSWSLVR